MASPACGRNRNVPRRGGGKARHIIYKKCPVERLLNFEPKEPDLMQRSPRDPKEPILTFPLFIAHGATLAEACTIVVNVIVVVKIFYLLNCRSLTHSIRSLGLFTNWWVLAGAAGMLGAQLLFT